MASANGISRVVAPSKPSSNLRESIFNDLVKTGPFDNFKIAQKKKSETQSNSKIIIDENTIMMDIDGSGKKIPVKINSGIVSPPFLGVELAFPKLISSGILQNAGSTVKCII
jgi:hypothetical protein